MSLIDLVLLNINHFPESLFTSPISWSWSTTPAKLTILNQIHNIMCSYSYSLSFHLLNHAETNTILSRFYKNSNLSETRPVYFWIVNSQSEIFGTQFHYILLLFLKWLIYDFVAIFWSHFLLILFAIF